MVRTRSRGNRCINPSARVEEGESSVAREESLPTEEYAEAMQPLNFFLKRTEYTKQCKVQTRCDPYKVLATLEGVLEPIEMSWFKEHPQFKHLFHMAQEQNRKVMGMWMLLLRTAHTEKRKQVWFVVNGVPIRYSIREYDFMSGLYCEPYPKEYEKLGSMRFFRRHFGKEEVEVRKVLEKLEGMAFDNERLKMVFLYFLSTVIRGKAKIIGGKIDLFLIRIIDDL